MAPALAQNTTSGLGGLVTGSDGAPASGAQVVIVHTESGSVSSSVTDATGRYSARGLRPGGPYTITITKNGVTEKMGNVFLQLAEMTSLDAKLGGQAIATMTITGAQESDKFSKSAMGAGTNISRSQLDALASIQRNLQDYARTDPRISQTDKERGEISVGGQNSRYNSITIDGVGINDTFGLEANGLPTAKQPISIDAIQSVQINVSNYDVTQKGYTGANINAVTKSGTNAFKGSVYYVFRDDRLVGMRYNASSDIFYDVPDFKETTKGVTLGGPIIKDKLFFFASIEDSSSTRSTPAFGPLGSPLTNVGITPSSIAAAQAIAKNKYGMDIGGSDAPGGAALTVKDALIKLDWNINDDHRASLRYAKTEQVEPIFAGFSATGLSLSSWWWKQGKTIESVVGQWFGDWTPNFSTELKISNRDYDSVPANNAYLPAMGLAFSGALPAGSPSGVSTSTRFLNFGTENSRQLNVLRTKTADVYLGANWTLDQHALKFGMDYSKNDIYNAFLQNVNGNYTFNCTNSSSTFTYTFGAINCATATSAQVDAAVLENFSRGRPSAYQVQVPVAGGTLSDAIAQFTLVNTGAFVQDTWTVSPKLSVMYGVRLDVPSLNTKPLYNAAASAAMVAGSGTTRQSGGFGRDNSNTIDGQELIQPRFGFNYKFEQERPTQMRGGFGLFQGAAANVWMSNPFSNTGVATRVVGCGSSGFSTCPSTDGTFNPDPTKQTTSIVGATPASNVDFIGASLSQPAVWKSNLAFDHQLPFLDLVLGVEYLYTKNETGIHYQHLNLGAPTGKGSDGRDLFYTPQGYNAACWSSTGSSITSGTTCTGFRTRALNNPNFNNVLAADKTKKGGGNLATLSLSRPMISGWSTSLAYTYTDATEVSPLTSSVANSNWAARSIFNPNEEVAANSAYLVKNRVNATLQFQQNLIEGYKSTFGMFYEGRTGKPFSWTFNNDLNGDGSGGNDLMYIPSAFGSGQVVFQGDTATSKVNETRFWDIVNANGLAGSAGKVVERNSAFAQWTNNFDMRLKQEIPGFIKGNKAVFVLDFLNVGNMLNKKWGRIDEVAFQSAGGLARSFVNYAGLDASGKYVYNVMPAVESTVVRQERGESQWAIQATVRYEF
jgi:hypothetical protein